MYNVIERRERPAWIGDKCKDCIYRCEECERHYNRAPETHMKNHSLCWCCKNSTNGMCEYIWLLAYLTRTLNTSLKLSRTAI